MPVLVKESSGSERPSVKKSAYERFQQALLQGQIRPGEVCSQKDLMALLGLSIGALRELLPRLEAEGLLQVLPQRGIQITIIDIPMIRHAFQMRVALEREAVLHALEHMADEILVAQRELHRQILDLVTSDPSPDLLDRGQSIDTNFHDLLITSTGNELLIHAYNVNSIRIRLIRLDHIKLSVETLPSAFADHIAIIDAILKRDRDAAVAAIESHLVHARARAISL